MIGKEKHCHVSNRKIIYNQFVFYLLEKLWEDTSCLMLPNNFLQDVRKIESYITKGDASSKGNT